MTSIKRTFAQDMINVRKEYWRRFVLFKSEDFIFLFSQAFLFGWFEFNDFSINPN